jgi:nucleotide-binding universal stress UspA family protein
MYKKILVPLDGSELAECVFPHVESIAQGCGVETVTFIRVAEPIHMPISGSDDGYTFNAEDWQRMESESRAAAENYLNQLMNRVKYDGVNFQSKVLTGGRAAEMIAEYASRNEVDLIVIATHGRSGISRWVWGSVADRVLRSACVPVLMVRAPGCVPGI